MRALIAFVLGLIVGGLIMLYVPNNRRDELEAQLQQQLNSLQSSMQKLGEQIKTVHIDVSPAPSASASPTASPAQ
jgi:uncharacterized membrane-anchored protein YhcB (DUF1043 family)